LFSTCFSAYSEGLARRGVRAQTTISTLQKTQKNKVVSFGLEFKTIQFSLKALLTLFSEVDYRTGPPKMLTGDPIRFANRDNRSHVMAKRLVTSLR
jgi:hypothetical protein